MKSKHAAYMAKQRMKWDIARKRVIKARVKGLRNEGN